MTLVIKAAALDAAAKFFPRPKKPAQAAIWLGYMDALRSPEGRALLALFGIVTRLRLIHLFVTWMIETGGLTLLWESGAYSADGIVKTFGPGKHTAAIGMAEARRIARLPVAERTRVLFERVYGSGNSKKAVELGNTEDGDGWRFRGLGPNQLTGREAHEKAAAGIGCSLEDLQQPLNLLHASLIEWRTKNCNAYADLDDGISIRKLINGGSLKVSSKKLNGVEKIDAAVAAAKALWPAGEDIVEEAQPPAPLPAWTTVVADLAPVSRKVSVLSRVRLALHGIWAAIAGLFTLENVGVAKSTVEQIHALVAEHSVMIIAAGAVCGVTLASYILQRIAEDHTSGRYMPSGGMPAAA